jgi:hypothetical protein
MRATQLQRLRYVLWIATFVWSLHKTETADLALVRYYGPA